jgi:hypothetical protein
MGLKNESKKVKPFKEWTRQEKRHATITLKSGRVVKILAYIEEIVPQLATIRNKDTGVEVNHSILLREIYMAHGYDGVAQYVEAVNSTLVKAQEAAKAKEEELSNPAPKKSGRKPKAADA